MSTLSYNKEYTAMTKDEVIKHYGSVREVAEDLNCWTGEVYRWGEYPPKGKQYEIEVKTGGKLKAEETK